MFKYFTGIAVKTVQPVNGCNPDEPFFVHNNTTDGGMRKPLFGGDVVELERLLLSAKG